MAKANIANGQNYLYRPMSQIELNCMKQFKSEINSQFNSIDTFTNGDVSPRVFIQGKGYNDGYIFDPYKISTLDGFRSRREGENTNNNFLPTDYLNSCSSSGSI